MDATTPSFKIVKPETWDLCMAGVTLSDDPSDIDQRAKNQQL